MFGSKPNQKPSQQQQQPQEQPEQPEQHLPVAVDSTALEERESKDLVDAAALNEAIEGMKREAIETSSYVDVNLETPDFNNAKHELMNQLIKQVDFVALDQLDEELQKKKVLSVCDKILSEIPSPLNGSQISALKSQALDEIFGFGPLEPLLADNEIADIMVNTHSQVYIEKQGKIFLTDVKFLDEQHLLTIVQRIVSRVGRRIDEASPMVDARMPDGSRFNAIIPPLALDGCLVSIRKFKKNKMPLSAYVQLGSMSEEMYKFLQLCTHIGLNIIVSGGTGSGKTTLLNALSGGISHGERIVTIEDAAELQLQQPHVLRLETRPPSMEGRGEVTQRLLVKNALRMRPDRIILGEIRGDEVIDVLTAMNTGHDGSMATIHSNSPRDCLSRIENLVGMSEVKLSSGSLRQQIASALQIIVQIERMRDGTRKVTQVEEVCGVEGDVISTQTLFSYKASGLDAKGRLQGEFICHGIRPKMLTRAEYFGLTKAVLECFTIGV
ncbi:MAG: CpaF family protein [Rickettsiales bacterium]|nr:CpaF family protein [Rickettsiales bacterium]